MKRRSIIILSAFLVCAAAVSSQAQGRRTTTTALADAARQALITALTGPDGEYAARAEYEAILDKFGSEVLPYAHIIRGEDRHVAALERQLQKFGVPIPEDAFLGKIEAPETLAEAADAGILAEQANVKMYDELLPAVQDYPSLIQVFNNLRSASLNKHLPALLAAQANGGTVTSEICNERGCMQGQGQGQAWCQQQGRGNGWGRQQGRAGGWRRGAGGQNQGPAATRR